MNENRGKPRVARSQQSTVRAPIVRTALPLLSWLVLLVLWAGAIKPTPIEKDSAETVRMALNLSRHGVMSLDEAAPFAPSMYREPLPVAMTALAVRASDVVLGPATDEEYFLGDRGRALKLQNLLWMSLLTSVAYWAILTFTHSLAAAWIGAALIGLLPFANRLIVVLRLDRLDVEPPAAALLLLASTCLALGFTRSRRGYIVVSAAAFAALALVKAAMAYVFAGVVVVLLVTCLWRPWRAQWAKQVTNVMLLAVVFALCVVPWMSRNQQALGAFAIADRGGGVLMIRAVKNSMTAQEYLGAFYVWSPWIARPVVGKLLGFSRQDLQRGGRLQRLNRSPTSDFAADDIAAERAGRPQDAISYYRRAKAEQVKVSRELAAAGNSHPDTAADELLERRALDEIAAHPFKHLATTLPFLWRGAAVPSGLIVVVCWLAVRRRNGELALLVLPAIGVIGFHALLTHFLPRYASPTIPLAMVALAIAVTLYRRPA